MQLKKTHKLQGHVNKTRQRFLLFQVLYNIVYYLYLHFQYKLFTIWILCTRIFITNFKLKSSVYRR
jgi:hypothetical protein